MESIARHNAKYWTPQWKVLHVKMLARNNNFQYNDLGVRLRRGRNRNSLDNQGFLINGKRDQEEY